MKILYIANIRIPTEKAHGIQIMKMCEAFSNLGNSVMLVVPRRRNYIKDDPFMYYGVKKNFSIKILPTLDLVRFGRIGFLIQSISFSVTSFIYFIFNKPDVIYSRDELSIWIFCFLKINTVYEAHMPRFNFIIRKFTKIVAISNGLKNFYIGKKVSKNKISVARDAVDLENFDIPVNKEDIRKKLGIPSGKPVVMYIGLLDPWKGVETLLKASQLIPEVTVVVVGIGSQLNKFKKEYTNSIFLGYTPYRDLPYNQKAADVLIVPNSGKSDVSRFYTSPLKVFTHMASGIPIVASDLPSIREILNEKNSTLVEADNPEALAIGIKYALSKDGHNALEDVKMNTWTHRAEKIVNFIEDI